MPATRLIDLPGLPVTVRELTVSEVRSWLVEVESGAPVDPLRAMVFDDCSLDDLARMADVSAARLEGLTGSELAPIYEAAKALNPHFFRVRAALTRVARLIEAETGSMISTAA
jgi:hypothetical protein